MDTVKISSGQAKIIAHRGLSGIERENTCPAFVAAGNRSYFGIEADVHITKDGKFIIIHDETTNRVTAGVHKINVERTTYSKSENIILPDLDGTTIRKDIKIPLLDEYLSICKKYGKTAVLEVKSLFSESDIKKLVLNIKALGYIENVIFISFALENCINLRKLLPQSQIQLLTKRELTSDIIRTLCENKLDLDINYKKLTKETVDLLHSHKIRVNCWTCDNKADAERLVDYGVDFITTNILE